MLGHVDGAQSRITHSHQKEPPEVVRANGQGASWTTPFRGLLVMLNRIEGIWNALLSPLPS